VIVLAIMAAIIATTVLFITVPGLQITPLGIFINDTIGQIFNLQGFFTNRENIISIVQTIVIVFLIWVFNQIVKFIVAILVKKARKQITLWVLNRSALKYASVIVGAFLILATWGVDTLTLVAGAGIIGLALSLGARSLIEDIISGLFFIFEKPFLIDDIIEVNGFRGRVSEIGVRTTTIVNLGGDIMIINNSNLRQIINTSRNLSPVSCDMPISLNEDLERVEQILNEHLPAIQKKLPDFVEGPFYKGVSTVTEFSTKLKFFGKTEELKKYQAERDLYRELKLLFDRHDIKMPFQGEKPDQSQKEIE
jgi:small conductance mechanosensitive channel